MTAQWGAVFPVIAPVFFCAMLGYFWQRSGRPLDTVGIGSLISNIGAPCLIIATLAKVKIDSAALTQIGLACVSVLTILGSLLFVLLKVFRFDMRTYLSPLLFGNVGNMGLPLCLFAFGTDGLALAVAYFMANSLLHFSLGTVLVSGQKIHHAILRNPIIWAVLVSVTLVVMDWQLPRSLQNTLDILGGFAIPMMLILLGASLSQLQLQHIGSALALSVFRISAGFAAGMFLAHVFELQGVARGVLIVQASMPVAVFNYVFARQFQRGESEVAALVLVSTLISFISLPFLINFVLQSS